MTHLRRSLTVELIVGITLLAGCGGGPSRILPPRIDADDSAEKAMELYDFDNDGRLNVAELEKVASLKAAMETVDADGDGQVSKSEISDRIRSWQSSRAGLSSILCYVTLDRQVLPGATVTFEPESFLGEEIQSAIGVSNRHGIAAPSIPKENRPMPDMPPGLQLGFFRIRVSKLQNGKETIPAKYNSETILGQQVANDDPAMMRHRISLDLVSR